MVYMCGMGFTFQIYWKSYDFLILIKILNIQLYKYIKIMYINYKQYMYV